MQTKSKDKSKSSSITGYFRGQYAKHKHCISPSNERHDVKRTYLETSDDDNDSDAPSISSWLIYCSSRAEQVLDCIHQFIFV